MSWPGTPISTIVIRHGAERVVLSCDTSAWGSSGRFADGFVLRGDVLL